MYLLMSEMDRYVKQPMGLAFKAFKNAFRIVQNVHVVRMIHISYTVVRDSIYISL